MQADGKILIGGNFTQIGGQTRTGFARFALAATAASVSITGRVANGKRGISNAAVYLTEQNGNTRTAQTSVFGYFRFDDIEVGQTLIVNVFHKRYQFDTQVVSLIEELTDLNFTANGNL